MQGVLGEVSTHSSPYVKIKLTSENKAKGFYLLMKNGNTYSDKEDEFLVERGFLKLLEDNGIDYAELST